MTALFFLVLITLPFGAKFLIYQFTPGFHEYETIFAYLSDVFIVAFLLFSVRFIRFRPLVTNYYLLVTFLFFTALSVLFAPSISLAVYSFLRLLVYVLFALAASRILVDQKIFRRALAVLAVLAAIQSFIGIWQFKIQDDLGLQILGEPPIGVFDPGTSKVILEGVKFVRAYGTFPHPNMLAAFLVLGLFALYYLWLNADAKFFNANDARKESSRNSHYLRQPRLAVKARLGIFSIGLGIFIVLLGLVLTFSRSAWFIAAVSTLLVIGYCLAAKDFRSQVLKLLFVLVISCLLLVNFFFWAIFPRARISATEPAVTQRLKYNELAFEIIKEKPFGVGIGNQVLYSVKNGLYQKLDMNEVWQWQPIHNLYLLIASEVGILGLLAFLVFLITLFFQPLAEEFRISAAMLFSLLIMAAADHFLWTLPQGQLMLWLVIGLMFAGAHSSADPEPKQVLGRDKQNDPSLPREMSS